MLLEGRTAIIYGGAGSIGGAVARAFAREGATVHIAGRNLENVERVATGAKEAFTDMDTLGVVIARMLERSGDAGVPSRPRRGSA